MQPFDGVLIGEALMGDGPEIMFGPALAVVAKAVMDCVAGRDSGQKGLCEASLCLDIHIESIEHSHEIPHG